MRIIFLIIFFLSIISFNGKTQIIHNSDQEHPNQVYLKTGIHPNFSYQIGYRRNIPLSSWHRNLSLYGELQGSFIRPLSENAIIKIGVQLPLLQFGSWQLLNDFYGTAAHLETIHYESNRFTIGNEIDFGYYSNRWYIAFSISYDWIYLNELIHTDFYREHFYQEAKDGWYRGGGGYFVTGIETGWRIGQYFNLDFSFEIPISEKGRPLGGSPAYITLGLGYRF